VSGGQRLTAAIVLAAAILLLGRAGAVLYANHAWFAALGAASVWDDEVSSTALLYGVALVAGTVFAWANISAVRRSVIALIVPKRIANVEFGEEVPVARLRLVTIAMSLFVAAAGTLALPAWTVLARWRSGISFGDLDPYLGLDLSHYVAWLPLERAGYEWATVEFAIVALLVVTLYSLTPSLRWTRHGVRATTHARRHIAVLGAILLLLVAWSFRLAAFDLLVNGSGAGGAFTRTDHAWLIPADAVLSIATLGAAVVLLAAGWMGQTGTALAAVSIVLLGALGARVAGPAISAARAASRSAPVREQPYLDTRDIYTRAAFPAMEIPLSRRYEASPATLQDASHVGVRGSPLPTLVYPGALGTEIVTDPRHLVQAPRLGTGLTRWLNAWAMQNPAVIRASLSGDDAVLATRDLRERVARIAPTLAQSAQIGILPSAAGVVWIVDLYATSGSYPLSAARRLGARLVTYSHHAATAYVSGTTGSVVIVPDPALDPIARAWFASHPGSYISHVVPAALTAAPPVAPVPAASGADSAFRARVTAAYDRMGAALRSGNLRAFGEAFDSLGRVIRPPEPPR